MDDNEFVVKYESFIKTFAFKYCRDKADKQDFEQELRIRLWIAYKEHYDPAKGKLSTWVYQTLQLHARKLRFDTLKQVTFEQEMLNSDYFHKEHYRYDPHFLAIAWDTSMDKLSSDKFPEFEHRIAMALSLDEKRVYNLVLRYSPNIRMSRVARELNLTKKTAEDLYDSIKSKVWEIHSLLYPT